MNEPRSWVAARLSALGDVALTTGVLEHWHRTRGWTFTVLTRGAFAPLFLGHPAVRAVEVLTCEELRPPLLFTRLRQLAAAHKGEGLLDLHGTPRTRLLGLLWKGPVHRFPKFSVRRRLFLASNGRWFGETLRRWNVPQRYALAADTTAPPRAQVLPRIFLSHAEQDRAAALLEPLQPLALRAPLSSSSVAALPSLLSSSPSSPSLPTGTPVVALHPYATHSHKAWPADYWRQLAAELQDLGVFWFVIGRGESPFASPQNDFSNRTDLRETCALLAKADVLVTGDSGPMHLAAGVGTPVVALFGPTAEEWGFFPQGQRDRVVQVDLPCRPCSLHGKRPCGHTFECMRRILPKEVLRAVLCVAHQSHFSLNLLTDAKAADAAKRCDFC